MHKRALPMLRFVEDPEGEGGGKPNDETGGTEGEQVKTFTQDEVNALLNRQKRDHRKEVSDLQAQVDGKKSLEDRIAELEAKGNESTQRALRAEVAAEFGVSTKRGPKGEPSDADLFLTGADEETLRSQAKRLADRETDRKKRGNVAPKEGGSADTGSHEPDGMREFTRALFQRDDD